MSPKWGLHSQCVKTSSYWRLCCHKIQRFLTNMSNNPNLIKIIPKSNHPVNLN